MSHRRLQRRKLLDYLITQIGDNIEESQGIQQLHITKQDDIVIGYMDKLRAQSVADTGIYQIKVQHPDPVQVPCGPLTTSGLINHNNYRIIIRHPPLNMSPIAISEAIHSSFRLIDVELENWKSPNRRNTPLAYGGLSVYIRCNNRDEALDIPGYLMIAGHKIKIWH